MKQWQKDTVKCFDLENLHQRENLSPIPPVVASADEDVEVEMFYNFLLSLLPKLSIRPRMDHYIMSVCV